MAVTQTSNLNDGVKRSASGSYIESGTAAAFSVTTGFLPSYIMVQNSTSGDRMEWFEGMAAASAIKTTASTGVITVISSLGITASARGFTVGLDLDVNVSAEQIRWRAAA
jgi:hypothetical protein